MPKYNFKCSACDNKQAFYVSVDTITRICPHCGQEMDRLMPLSSGPAIVKEMIDKYTGVSLPPDNKEILDARRSEYFWSVEVPRLVNEYPLEHSLAEGWMYYDEHNKLQVQTKPPHKR